MIQKKKGPFNKIHIVENTRVGGDNTPWSWNSDSHEIKKSNCIPITVKPCSKAHASESNTRVWCMQT
jgi:hypothetical protein